MLGKKIGNKAQLIGAIAGTIPDLDILLNPFFSDEITKLQIHRGYSHSMFIHLILAIPFAWMCFRIFKRKIDFRTWYITWYLGFLTHALLDCCTTYGTQLFLPFTNYLVGLNNIAVVDPFWTIPFLLLLIGCLFIKRENPSRLKLAKVALTYSLIYMAYTFGNKWYVHQKLSDDLAAKQIMIDKLSTTPSMFNNWLWSGIATTNDSIYLCEYSVLQEEEEIEWVSYARNAELINNHPAQRELKILQWFGQDKYLAVEQGEGLDFFVAKWGRTNYESKDTYGSFWFYWKVVPDGNGWRAYPHEPEISSEEFSKAWNQLWHRVKSSKPLAE